MGGCFLFNRVSRPIIPLHKEELMKKEVDLFYVKRTQRDYSLSFNQKFDLQVMIYCLLYQVKH